MTVGSTNYKDFFCGKMRLYLQQRKAAFFRLGLAKWQQTVVQCKNKEALQ